jgi:hypothetical protein
MEDQDLFPAASSSFPTLPPALLEALRQPFAPDEVRLRAGRRRPAAAQGCWECEAVPALERRVIEARLDALVPSGWSTTSPALVVAADRITVSAQVTIGRITHTDYGEVSLTRPIVPDAVGELSASVPEAFERAFLRVCARFGLGRYLAELAREWVPYDAKRGCLALSPEQQRAHLRKLYQQAGLALPPEKPEPPLCLAPALLDNRIPSLHAEGEGRAIKAVTRESLRARDLAWIRQQCASHAGSLARILQRWQVRHLEELSDAQVTDIINSIHQSRARSARPLAHAS